MKLLDLTNEELCRLTQSGDSEAGNRLTENNIGFIKTIAAEAFQNFGNVLGMEFDDFVQEGMIAFWKCISKYDENSGATFLTYAKPAIKNVMTDWVRKHLTLTQTESTSLDEYIENGERRLLSALTDSCYSKSPERLVINIETIREMYAALNSLENRERTYLLYRFGFKDGREHSIADTAFQFSLSVSRAKSIEKAAINKMRKLMLL